MGAPQRASRIVWRKLYDAGYQDSVIGGATGVSQTAVWKWRVKNGLPSNAKRGRHALGTRTVEEQIEEAKAMIQ